MVCQSLSSMTLSPASCTPAELAFACLAFAWITKRACRLPAVAGAVAFTLCLTLIGDSYELS
jgi:hypothetical protein